LPDGLANPAAKISRFREEGRERFLSTGERARLGDPPFLAAQRALSATAATAFDGSAVTKRTARPKLAVTRRLAAPRSNGV